MTEVAKAWRPPGRPRVVETPEEWDRAFDEYLQEQEEKGERPLLTGAMLALGIYDYSVFYSYRKRPEFHKSVSRVVAVVTQSYEKCLHGGGTTQGAQFALKNIRGDDGSPAWKDKIEVDVRGNLDVSINIDGWADDNKED